MVSPLLRAHSAVEDTLKVVSDHDTVSSIGHWCSSAPFMEDDNKQGGIPQAVPGKEKSIAAFESA